jgi:hypothetical protein
MCTVTFVARKRGYALGMNRDEKLTRAKGLPPKVRTVNGVKVLSPSEPDGGTWIALNETGVTLALINWYSVANRVATHVVSRGEVIETLCASTSLDPVDAGLRKLPLAQINPFRLIGVFPADRSVIEWRWDLNCLVIKNLAWETQQWISSGFDEPAAQRVRDQTFLRALCQTSPGVNWLRRLHRSHNPQVGPFSTCMHRADAATVSYTEISVSSRASRMSYHAGAPCQNSGTRRKGIQVARPHLLVTRWASALETSGTMPHAASSPAADGVRQFCSGIHVHHQFTSGC